jgi:hypothetical protein
MDMISFVNCPVGASSSGHSPGRCLGSIRKIRKVRGRIAGEARTYDKKILFGLALRSG